MGGGGTVSLPWGQVNEIDPIRKVWLLEGLPPSRGLLLLQLLLQPPCLPRLSSPWNWIEDNIVEKLKCLRHIYILGQGKSQVATLWHSPLWLPRGTPLTQATISTEQVFGKSVCWPWRPTQLKNLTQPETRAQRKAKTSSSTWQGLVFVFPCMLHLLPGAQETVHRRHPVAERCARSSHQ